MINPLYSVKSAILVSIRPFDNLRFVPTESGDGKVSYTLISDVSLLLNSERIIDTLGEDVYRHLVNSMMPKKSPYQDNKIPDKELFFVKPRNCQEHSELRAWSQLLISSMDDVKAAAEKAAAEKAVAEKATAEQTSVVES